MAPTEAEIATMGTLLEDALKAGAAGFTTSRTIRHRTSAQLKASLEAIAPERAVAARMFLGSVRLAGARHGVAGS